MFISFSQQILRDSLLLPVIGGLKSNLNGGFKFEPITTYHLLFVVKIL